MASPPRRHTRPAACLRAARRARRRRRVLGPSRARAPRARAPRAQGRLARRSCCGGTSPARTPRPWTPRRSWRTCGRSPGTGTRRARPRVPRCPELWKAACHQSPHAGFWRAGAAVGQPEEQLPEGGDPRGDRRHAHGEVGAQAVTRAFGAPVGRAGRARGRRARRCRTASAGPHGRRASQTRRARCRRRRAARWPRAAWGACSCTRRARWTPSWPARAPASPLRLSRTRRVEHASGLMAAHACFHPACKCRSKHSKPAHTHSAQPHPRAPPQCALPRA